MKQIVQNFKNGKLTLKEVPSPNLSPGGILVKTANSLISVGTEKYMLDIARKSLIGKAKERPDQVKQVIDKVKKEGLRSTYQKVMNQLDEPKPLGYSCSGIVLAIGDNGGNFRVGDRVACGGAGYANHGEVNFVPKNLAVKIPGVVSMEEAAYTTVGAIALQGIRQADPKIGDVVFVLGLGLLGLITIQLLKANGCIVIGSDLDPAKVKIAQKFGMDYAISGKADHIVSEVDLITQSHGADITIITAGTKSNEPIELAAEVTRQKGRVVAVGVIPLNVPRNAFYLKEIDLRLSMSYGPGRYDTLYEERGQDYPYAYVRWTEQRNMQAILNLIGQKKLDVKSLTSHKFNFDKAEEVYKELMEGKKKYLGVLFQYDRKRKPIFILTSPPNKNTQVSADIVIGLIGAGNYAGGILYPQLKKYQNVQILAIATSTGVSAEDKAKKYSAQIITTDYIKLLKEKNINTVFITTRHNLHAEQIVQALKAKKHVFVEKPIALSIDELNLIKNTYEKSNKVLLVGYNRRYSPLALKLKQFIESRKSAINILYRVNAGIIPKDHWIQDPAEGGGRVIGEVCHFIDFLIYLTGSLPEEVYTTSLNVGSVEQVIEDNISVVFKFRDGSVGTILYSAIGGAGMEKEYIEVFAINKSAKLTDFKSLTLYDGYKSRKINLGSQDKGQAGEIKHFFDVIKGDAEKFQSFEEIYFGSLSTFKILESLRTGKPVSINL
jgi:predicted dehydrogenase/threonine dehydrogenase-like Zn-dependent dehydrogenase